MLALVQTVREWPSVVPKRDIRYTVNDMCMWGAGELLNWLSRDEVIASHITHILARGVPR